MAVITLLVAVVGSAGLVAATASSSVAAAALTLIDVPSPAGGANFGGSVDILTNGNYVVVDSSANRGASAVGAVSLYNGATNQLISTLTGSSAMDQVGYGGIVEVGTGNFLVLSPKWDNGSVADSGAITWVDGATGLSGQVSAANSLVSGTSDTLGAATPTVLPNGNYVVSDSNWSSNAGAIAWGSGQAGVRGQISAANSLVSVLGGITVLTNSNFVISAPYGNGLGLTVWIDGNAGRVGALTAADGLTGSTVNDAVGSKVVALRNGNYVLLSPNWDEPISATVLDGTDIGAATWASGTTGLSGTISAANSLVGGETHDRIGAGGAIALAGGDYVVLSPYRSREQGGQSGAATWASGTGPTSAMVTDANSIRGSSANDHVGDSGTALDNGSYVVQSNEWKNGSAANAGAATWAAGGGPTSLTVDATNSIVGSTAGDRVGGGVVALANSSYVIATGSWHNGSNAFAGAWTWATGMARTGLVVDATNSRVGTRANDASGGSVVALASGGFVVVTPAWNASTAAGVGAVGWGNGTSRITGAIDRSNSLVGSTTNDHVGASVVVGDTGSYVVASSTWDGPGGADTGFARVVNGATGAAGTIDATNSLIGATANDMVSSGGVDVLADGNYVVLSPDVDGAAVDTGAVTWMSAATGLAGHPSATNSLVGSTAADMIGDDPFGHPFGAEPDGGYLIKSARWHQGASRTGALTVAGPGGLSGPVSTANSVSVAELNGGVYMSYDIGYTAMDGVVVGRPHDSVVTVALTADKTPPTLANPANVSVVAAQVRRPPSSRTRCRQPLIREERRASSARRRRDRRSPSVSPR